MLLKVEPAKGGRTTLKNMHVPHYPEMSLFQTAIELPQHDTDSGKITVTYTPARGTDKTKKLEIPLRVSSLQVKSMKTVTVTMHQSPTTGYDMGDEYNEWFSECFGYPVVLAYLGTNTRGVLGTLAPRKRNKMTVWAMWWREVGDPKGKEGILIGLLAVYVIGSVVWKGYDMVQQGVTDALSVKAFINTFGAIVVLSALHWTMLRRREDRIGFADCAPFLVISETSVDNVSARLPDGEEMDRTKFRPNIVVSGAESAFDEDFWTELAVGPKRARLFLTGNCVRCKSLNVDYGTGKMGTGESGSVLKKLMKDRRVDRGARFSPVFGRYSFLDRVAAGERIRVGDEVEVVKRGKERTVTGEFGSLSRLLMMLLLMCLLDWPGLTN
jgi:glycine hydroxymethyltransferase